MSDRLPAGIYFRVGETAPDFFRLVTFNFQQGVVGPQARAAIHVLWDVLEGLKAGIVRDLSRSRPDDPEVIVEPHALQATLCLGSRLFNDAVHEPDLVRFKPGQRNILRHPSGPFSRLKWGPTARPDAAQTDFAFALHAKAELGVARAVVELQKAIDDAQLPVDLVCFYSGLHRDDRRSWIDFHDGINNMRSGQERLTAIEIKTGEGVWLVGGTTMLFLKIEIDLQGWRKLARAEQEALVGRDKLSGCPLIDVRRSIGDLNVTLEPGCPYPLPRDGPFVEVPTSPGSPVVAASHIHRANLQRGGPEQIANNRIFRQGYEFVDSPPDGGVRVGLNFVSFQNHFDRVTGILNQPGWMGDANFGGGDDAGVIAAFDLMRVVAGGYFLVPPISAPFPGAEVFAD